MYEVIRQDIKFTNKTYKRGELISDQEFSKEVPDKRRKQRIISQYLDSGKIVEVNTQVKVNPQVEDEADIPTSPEYPINLGKGRYQFPNGIVEYKGKGGWLLPDGRRFKDKEEAFEAMAS